MSERHETVEPTAPPRRSPHPPREGVPVPTLDPGSVTEHWRKHPSDYHADNATAAMGRAASAADSAVRAYEMRVAETQALLSVRDALLEAVATTREMVGRVIDSNERLDQDIQTAAQHLHKDAQELRAHLRVVVQEDRDAA